MLAVQLAQPGERETHNLVVVEGEPDGIRHGHERDILDHIASHGEKVRDRENPAAAVANGRIEHVQLLRNEPADADLHLK